MAGVHRFWAEQLSQRRWIYSRRLHSGKRCLQYKHFAVNTSDKVNVDTAIKRRRANQWASCFPCRHHAVKICIIIIISMPSSNQSAWWLHYWRMSYFECVDLHVWGSLCLFHTLCPGHRLFLWLQLCMTVFRNEPDYITPWSLPQKLC